MLSIGFTDFTVSTNFSQIGFKESIFEDTRKKVNETLKSVSNQHEIHVAQAELSEGQILEFMVRNDLSIRLPPKNEVIVKMKLIEE